MGEGGRRPGEGSVADRIALLGGLRLLATSTLIFFAPSRHLRPHSSRNDKEPRNYRHRISPGEGRDERFRAGFVAPAALSLVERDQTFPVPLQTCTASALGNAKRHNDLKVAVVTKQPSLGWPSDARPDRDTTVAERKSFQNSPVL